MTINITSRVQGLADSRSIVATQKVVENAQASAGSQPIRRTALRGIADEMSVYNIP